MILDLIAVLLLLLQMMLTISHDGDHDDYP